MSVLLYAAKIRPTKQKDIRRLESFQHCCLRKILSISRVQQYVQRISKEVWDWFEMTTPLLLTIPCRGLRWLGHDAWMNDVCLLKQFLFGWLPNPCPVHGIKLRWRDNVRRDLKVFSIDERTWYALAHGRQSWLLQCTRGASTVPLQPQSNLLVCCVYTQGPLDDHNVLYGEAQM